MAIQLIADSCCDVTPALHQEWGVQLVPLVLRTGGREFVDDEGLDPNELLEAMESSSTGAGSACPAPEAYACHMRAAEESIVVTLSGKLSGSYNAAAIARDMVLEENPEKKIVVLDSESAAAGESLLILNLRRWVDAGLPFEDVVARGRTLAERMSTLFVLESLDNLVKNGRISKAAGLVSTVLNLRPIMSDNGHGEIVCLHKVRGTAHALRRLVQVVEERTKELAVRSVDLVMTHCACAQRAAQLREELLEKCPAIREVVVVPAAGVSTVYANRGGIVIAF